MKEYMYSLVEVLPLVNMCNKYDNEYSPAGSSPLTGLTPGLYRLRVVPVGCEVNQGVTFRFNV